MPVSPPVCVSSEFVLSCLCRRSTPTFGPSMRPRRQLSKFTMTRLCAASGCSSVSAGFSTFCTRHRKTLTRHGHAEQSPVTVHELRPYVRKVAARHKANRTSPAWTILTDRWARTVEQARQTIAAYEAGRVSFRHAVQAAHQVKTLAGSVPALAVVHTYAAMYLEHEHRSRWADTCC
jgi:hypothetical protein